jgi:hypothetical protein
MSSKEGNNMQKILIAAVIPVISCMIVLGVTVSINKAEAVTLIGSVPIVPSYASGSKPTGAAYANALVRDSTTNQICWTADGTTYVCGISSSTVTFGGYSLAAPSVPFAMRQTAASGIVTSIDFIPNQTGSNDGTTSLIVGAIDVDGNPIGSALCTATFRCDVPAGLPQSFACSGVYASGATLGAYWSPTTSCTDRPVGNLTVNARE